MSCAAIDAFRVHTLETNTYAAIDVIQYIYENITKGSGMRRFIIDYFVRKRPTEGYIGGCERYMNPDMHPDFLSEIAVALFKTHREPRTHWKKKDWNEISPCEYHDHAKPEGGSEDDGDD